MPFPLRSMEQIYSDIAAAGYESKFSVVPEHTLYYNIDGQRCSKKADLVWIKTRDNVPTGDDLLPYKVVAAFEIEGFDVPLATISLHSEVYQYFHGQFRCYVPIYSLATHRPEYGHNIDLVNQRFNQRHERAAEHHEVVTVCNGMHRDWLLAARQAAEDLAQNWLGQF